MPVAEAAGRAALLVVLERLQLRAQAGGTVPPGSTPSDRSACSRSSASRSSVIAFASSPAISSSSAAASTAPDTLADAERELERARDGASRACSFGGEAVRHADVGLRLASGPGRLGQADAVARDDELGDLVDARARAAARVRTRERMVGIRSASLGAQRIQMVRGGGSSSALSSTFEVRSVIRSASSMTITR